MSEDRRGALPPDEPEPRDEVQEELTSELSTPVRHPDEAAFRARLDELGPARVRMLLGVGGLARMDEDVAHQWLRERDESRTTESASVRWDHRMERLDGWDEAGARLTELGQDGWEVVACAVPGPIVVLKRRSPE